jgi:thiosulfate/3-mercaptopyruvate sulfurtransferase
MIDLAQQPLVETDWLAAHLDDPHLRIVDARWRGDGSGCRLYRSGHIRGAVHVDWRLDLGYTADGVRDRLLPGEWFAAMMRALGVGDETRVVAYAETDYSGAARLWWALRYYGHAQVAVLNGGITKWLAEGRSLDRDVPLPDPARFTPRPQPRLLATAAEIEQALADPRSDVRLVDTRPIEQYHGEAVWTPLGSLYLPPGQTWVEVDGRRMRGGHIPGAIHLHATRNFNPDDWTYLPADQLREQARAAGIEPGDRVITYCGVGISASAGLFALHLAGQQDIALYDASWEEWGTDPSRPIERGEQSHLN